MNQQFLSNQEIPCISWNVEVHYSVDKSPPFVPILSHMNPIHLIPSHFIKIHYNIIPYTVIPSLLADSYLAVLQCHPKKKIRHSSWVAASKFSSWVSEPYHLMFKELKKSKKQLLSQCFCKGNKHTKMILKCFLGCGVAINLWIFAFCGGLGTSLS